MNNRYTYRRVIMLIDVSYVELFMSKLKNLEIRVIVLWIHAQNLHDGLISSEQKLPVRRFIGNLFRWRRGGNVERRL